MTAAMALVVWGLVAGLDWRVVAMIAVSLAFPVWALAAIVVHCVRNRDRGSSGSAVFCQAVARELRSGSSLRAALAAASISIGLEAPARLLEMGETLDLALPEISSHLPDIGRELAVVTAAAAESGVAAAPLFDEMGDLALAQIAMAEEVRVATAPARASALVLIGLPSAYLAYQFRSGAAASLVADPVQRTMALIGLALVAVGLGVGMILVRRSL